MSDVEALRARWTHLYRNHLPALAKARDPVQKVWPVFLDHCFSRIVLDNAVGVDRPWTEVVKAPAVRNMSASQLEAAVDLGERLATGMADLVELDDRSLGLRGKGGKKRKVEKEEGGDEGEGGRVQGDGRKRVKGADGTISGYFLPSPTSPNKRGHDAGQATDRDVEDVKHKGDGDSDKTTEDEDMSVQLNRIATSTLTPFRKQMLTLLCQIPRGRYSTYQAMSDHVTKTSHKSCARAVGNAMKNNPFAPEVPCHRVLATGGSLGGFKGDWGVEGRFASEKQRLLHEEGVRFDSRGKVKGAVFREFKT